MTAPNENSKQNTIENAPPRRFRIEKLEERIAPAKGGIPGKPDDTTCYYDCCKGNPKHCRI